MTKPGRVCFLILYLIAIIKCQLEPYIVGGNFGSVANFPHSAFLSIHCTLQERSEGDWICGSSIVNQKIFLTAGHCLASCTQESYIKITMGNEYMGRGYSTYAHSYIVHEDYNSLTYKQDIALVRSTDSLKFNAKISRVALMRRPPYNEKSQLAGWGSVDDSKIVSNVLKYLDQTVWKHDECVKYLDHLNPGTLCAAGKTSSDYAAQGDSGSALVVRGYIQIGIVSYKVPTRARHIVVYTDVGYYYNWITNGVHKLFCHE